MGKPLAGEVVVLPFPQTNTRASERRSVGASERHASRSTLHASLFPLDLSLSVSATESNGNGLLSSETLRHTGGLSYHTSTGPLGTGIRSRWATAGSCMNEATSGGGWNRGFSAPFSSRNCWRQRR